MTKTFGEVVGFYFAPPNGGWMTSYCGGGYAYGTPDGGWVVVADDGTERIQPPKEPV
jgi:hypothetical protein